MMARRKRILLQAVLCLLLLWPPLHFVLGTFLHFNNWKFFGLAMYCTPPPVVSIELFNKDHSTLLSIDKIFSQADPLQAHRFIRYRANWGYVHTPTTLAKSVLRSWPQLSGLGVVVHTTLFDGLKGQPYVISDYYSCERGQACSWLKKVEQRV